VETKCDSDALGYRIALNNVFNRTVLISIENVCLKSLFEVNI